MSYEAAVARAEQIVTILTSGATPLAEALALFEEGVQQLRVADAALSGIEARAMELMNATEAPNDL